MNLRIVLGLLFLGFIVPALHAQIPNISPTDPVGQCTAEIWHNQNNGILWVCVEGVWQPIGGNQKRTCDIAVGDTSGTAIVSGQLGPQKRLCIMPTVGTLLEVEVSSDAGTPNVIVAKNHQGTVTNILSAALQTAASGGVACANTTGTLGIDGVTTCSRTLQNVTVAAGDYLELVSGTADNIAKLMTIHIVYKAVGF